MFKWNEETYNPGCSCRAISASFRDCCTKSSFQRFAISSPSAANIRQLCASSWSVLRVLDLDESTDLRTSESACFHPTPERTDTSIVLAGLYFHRDWESSDDLVAERPDMMAVMFSSTWRRGARRAHSLRSSGLTAPAVEPFLWWFEPMESRWVWLRDRRLIMKLTDRTRLRWMTGRQTSTWGSRYNEDFSKPFQRTSRSKALGAKSSWKFFRTVDFPDSACPTMIEIVKQTFKFETQSTMVKHGTNLGVISSPL